MLPHYTLLARGTKRIYLYQLLQTKFRCHRVVEKKYSTTYKTGKDPVQVKWPRDLLDAAVRSKRLPNLATESSDFGRTYENFLDAFVALRAKNDFTGDLDPFDSLLHEYNISPRDLMSLTKVLLRNKTRPEARVYHKVVKDLVLLASSKGERSALIAFAFGKIAGAESLAPSVWLRVRDIAEGGDRTMLTLLAQKAKSNGEVDRALEFAERALGIKPTKASNGECEEFNIPELWRIIYDMKLQRGDATGAKEAMQLGATGHDDPHAYWEFAQKYLSTEDDEQIRYLIKAASSGVPQAAIAVGRWYIGQAKRVSSSIQETGLDKTARVPKSFQKSARKSSKLYSVAMEWFRVALMHPQTIKNGGEIPFEAVRYILACSAATGFLADVCNILYEDMKGRAFDQQLLKQIEEIRRTANDLTTKAKLLKALDS